MDSMSKAELAMLVLLVALRNKTPAEFAEWAGCSLTDALEIFQTANLVLLDYVEITRPMRQSGFDCCDY